MNPNAPLTLSPAKAYERLYEALTRERRSRERFLKEPRRSVAVQEMDDALIALEVIIKTTTLTPFTQLSLLDDQTPGSGGPPPWPYR
ncbi:hypothetical protein LCGC14_0759810 [marine sediment metagenome]|uniref:Uncharacterized protein n=1 Tax=marine sediment metagenome TaxID=412755 RepID=A0A0F9SLQ7_9ZZZZ